MRASAIMSKTKIAYLIYQTHAKANGGVASIIQIIKSLDKSAFEVTVITNRETDLIESLGKDVSLVLMNWPNYGILRRLTGLFQFTTRLLTVFRQSGIQILHVNDIYSLQLSFLASFLARKKMVFNIRDVFVPEKPYGKAWYLVNFCQAVFVLSNDMSNTLKKRLPLLKPRKDKLIFKPFYSIVDLSLFRPQPEKKRDDKTLLFAATFNEKKNQLEFIKKCAKGLIDRDYSIIFAGDFENDYGRNCVKAVDELGFNQSIQFIGFRPDMHNWYVKASLTIVPTRREGLARCMIESLSCGTPVVSFDVASAHEILTEGHCGIVVPQGDYESFQAAIFRLGDQEERTVMATNARKLAESLFDKSLTISEMETSYQNLLRN